jgi:hypothetical protein
LPFFNYAKVLAACHVAENAVKHFLGDALIRPNGLAMADALSILEIDPP